jgi:hypothetical protein
VQGFKAQRGSNRHFSLLRVEFQRTARRLLRGGFDKRIESLAIHDHGLDVEGLLRSIPFRVTADTSMGSDQDNVLRPRLTKVAVIATGGSTSGKQAKAGMFELAVLAQAPPYLPF